MAAPGSEFDRDMRELEAEMKRLEAEYNMYFAGRLPRPPWETRARVEAIVKRYDRRALVNTGQRFRFSTLQARFVKFSEMWSRAVRVREEGTPQGAARRTRAPAPPPPPPAAAGERGPAGNRVVHVAAFHNPSRQQDDLRELFEQISDARRHTGEHPVSFDRLAEVVQRQVDRLGGEEAEVVFRVVVESGKVTLTAKRRDVR